ncbi:hypothetical protein BLA60_27650 [Actinophytocola xinjiangensis]|uniref:Uncharacterized protein n=1 Tax=Actinophytocola xinjiangensis TaxID=485602 RepID=A0A7Z0WHH1_9PSEU|nr:hypothetical protein [Actinophytocola xinjiangensis]OLF07349.1 hypothetical protein BLA60_27650 [Actinophytocola xinjiangensis]
MRTLFRRRRNVVLAAVAVLLVAVGVVVVTVRLQASGIVDDAEAAHRRGDCAESVATLDGFGSFHRLAAGDIVRSAEPGRQACRLLDKATGEQGRYDPRLLAEYVDHPGARWPNAGVELSQLLLGLDSDGGTDGDTAGDTDGDVGRDPKSAMKRLNETLAAYPGMSAAVRELVEAYVERFGESGYARPVEDEYGSADPEAAARVCADRDEFTWLHAGDWTRPEMAEPIAATEDLADEWLLACANATAALGDMTSWGQARTMYDEYLTEYADQPGAQDARKGRDEVVGAIQHRQARDRAIARAGKPADGANLGACRDGRCQVRVTPGNLLTINGPGGPYQVLVSGVGGGSVTVAIGGQISSFNSTGGSITVFGGNAAWSSGPKGELTLNDRLGVGVDGVAGGRATLSVWLVS